MRMVSVALLCAAVACGDNDHPPQRTVAPSPTEGVDSEALAALLIEHWDLEAAIDPLSATNYGDHRVDAELPPVRHADVQALRDRRHALLAAARALDPAGLGARDRVTYGVLVDRLTVGVGLEACDYERWAVSGRIGLFFRLDDLPSYHPLIVPEDAATYLARVQAMPAAIDALAAELAAGAAAGEVNRKQAVADAFSAVEAMATRPTDQWPLVYAIDASELDGAARDRLRAQVRAVIADELAPAYLRLGATLHATVLPAAREVEGLSGLPQGTACYAGEIRRHTSLPLTAAELHALGEAEVARIEGEMRALGAQIYGTDTLDQLRAALAADISQRFASEQEILDWAKMIITRAQLKVTPLFARFPQTELEITPYPPEAGPIAASYGQSVDGSPARFYLAIRPASRQTRWDLEATTYHESIPGHHLQVGRAVELTGLPAIRQVFADTAFIEGWGLYAETLADEIGMYTTEVARIGRLSNEALRACRLVIDTGLHELGWTRAQATDYLVAHTLAGRDFAATEIERYLNGPGQALAYKVGERELLRLRGVLQARDGAAFSLRDFHEAVLETGSMPLPTLADHLMVSPPGARARPARGRVTWPTGRPPMPAPASGFRAPSFDGP